MKKIYQQTLRIFILNLFITVLYFNGYAQWTSVPTTNATNPGTGSYSRWVASSVTISNTLYQLGGSPAGGVWDNTLWKYDSGTKVWTNLGTYPGGGCTGTFAFAINGKAYFGGGDHGGAPFKDLYEYNPANGVWTKMTDIPCPGKCCASTFSIGNYGYVGIGGNAQSSWASIYNDFWRFDPATGAGGTWTQMDNFIGGARYCASSFVINGLAYVGLGMNNVAAINDFYKFDPTAATGSQWTAVTSLPASGRAGGVSFTICNKGFAVFGSTGTNTYTPISESWMYNPTVGAGGSWTQLANFSGTARFLAQAFVIADTAYITGGGDAAFNSLADMWKFTSNAAFTASSTNSCTSGVSINFTDQTPLSSGWSWSFPGGTPNTSTLQNPVITYNTPGTYDVTLTTTGICGGVTTLTKTAYINIGSGSGLAGTYTIDNNIATTYPTGTNFHSFREAINALQCQTGPVIFNVNPTTTYNESNLLCVAPGTWSILFQPDPAFGGAHPLIQSVSGGLGVGVSSMDGFIILQGTNNITFDRIDLLENVANATAATQMEWGYALLKNSTSDGCQNDVIKNCVITLNRTNASSVGIYSNNHTPASTTALVLISVNGANSNNKFFGNTISNVYSGIVVTGDPTTTTYYDQNNEIGVSGANAISNFGGGANATYGIYCGSQNNIKISNNTITAGTGNTGNFYGILSDVATNANVTINSNTITPGSSSTTSLIYPIYNMAGASGTTNTVNINLNTIQNLNWATQTTGSFFGIQNTATAYNLLIHDNTITNITTSGTGVFNAVRSVANNDNSMLIYGNNVNTVTTGSSNSLNTSAFFISNSGASTNNQVYSNVVNNINFTYTGASTFRMFRLQGSMPLLCYSNTISNCTVNAAGAATFLAMNILTTGTSSVYNNTIAAIAIGTGNLTGIGTTSGTTTNTFNNKVYGLSSSTVTGNIYGISITGGTTNTVYNNMVSDLRTPLANTAAAIYGIYLTAGTIAAYYNSVYLSANTTSSAATFGTIGVYTTSAVVTTFKNNLIVNLSVPKGAGLAVAHRRNGAFTSNLTSDYNAYNATTIAYNEAIATAYNFASVQTNEPNSLNVDPQFTIGALTNLHQADMAMPSVIQLKGTPIAGITADIDVDARNSSTPDIGFDEVVSTLPIELLSFTGKNQGTENLLEWATASEINNDYFTLERSIDGEHFESITKIKGAGNSNSTNNYAFLDSNPDSYRGSTLTSNIYYYRLKQTDFNGDFNYSKTVAIQLISNNQHATTIYPNPTNDNLSLTFFGTNEDVIKLEVIDMLGKCLINELQPTVTGSNTLTINTDNLAKGFYFLKINGSSKQESIRFLKN